MAPEGHQLAGQRFRLRATVLVQRSASVVALVAGLDARRAVPHDQHRRGVGRLSGERLEHVPVVRVGEALRRILDRQPFEQIDFRTGSEFAAQRACRPVVNDLGALRNLIVRLNQTPAQLTALTGFLPDFAHRGDRFVLTGIDFALGQRPVVVARPVNHRDM